LKLDKGQSALLNQNSKQRLQETLSKHFDKAIKLTVEVQQNIETPASITKSLEEEKLKQATEALQNDPLIKKIIKEFDANIIPETISPTHHTQEATASHHSQEATAPHHRQEATTPHHRQEATAPSHCEEHSDEAIS